MGTLKNLCYNLEFVITKLAINRLQNLGTALCKFLDWGQSGQSLEQVLKNQ